MSENADIQESPFWSSNRRRSDARSKPRVPGPAKQAARCRSRLALTKSLFVGLRNEPYSAVTFAIEQDR